MLVFVPTPIGNLEDISLRSLNMLKECDVILCEDTRVTSRLLYLLQQKDLLPLRHVRLIAVHSHNELDVVNRLGKDFFNQLVVYLSDAGMPCISDPGSLLVRYAQENQIPYTILPGANAALTTFAASGFASKSFLFYGFLPHKAMQKERELSRLLSLDVPVVCYESPHRLVQTLTMLETLNAGEVFVAKEVSKRFEAYFRGDIPRVVEQIGKRIRGEWSIVLNPVMQNITQQCSLDEIADLLPPKVLAKIKARLSGRCVQECYDEMHSPKEDIK